MSRPISRTTNLFVAAFFTLTTALAHAHSASDAYLSFQVEPQTVGSASARTIVHGQWDIALRDLDFVLKLDDDGDGNIRWDELRRHQAEIVRYAYPFLHLHGDGKACAITPVKQLVDDHADGAYAALFFDIECTGKPKRLTLDYRLFFAIDPSHRGLLVLRSGSDTATAVLSPENARIDLKIDPASAAEAAKPPR